MIWISRIITSHSIKIRPLSTFTSLASDLQDLMSLLKSLKFSKPILTEGEPRNLVLGAQASLCGELWKVKGRAEFRPVIFEVPELWITQTVAEIAYLHTSSDEKPGCQMGKILILMGKKFGKHVSHWAWSTHTDKPSLQPSVSFSPYLVRKHIYKCNLFHFLVAEASLTGFQNDTTEDQSLTSIFGKKTQERQHLPWGTA